MPRLTAIRKQALDDMMKAALFEAAAAVLAKHGVEGMTMERVAGAAKVAKGSVYRYFRSKRELLEFVYAKTVDPIHGNLAEVAAADAPAVEKLSRHLGALLEHSARHRAVFHLLFHDDTAQGVLASKRRHNRETAARQLAGIFRQGVAEGTFRAVDPLTTARLFIGMCVAVFEGRPALDDPAVRAAVRRSILGTLLNGIGLERNEALE